MKKSLLFAGVLCATVMVNAQTYYNMWRGYGDSGRPEWIANSAMSYGFSGIQFTTADRPIGFANSSGRWLLINPNESVLSSQYVNQLNNNLNQMPRVALGTEGYMASNRMIITDIGLSSSVDSYWGYGRNDEIIISNQMAKLFRINSYGGIGLWGNGDADTSDIPHLEVRGKEVNVYTEFNLKGDASTVNATLGYGPNGDILFSTASNKLFRASHPAGLAIWTDGKVSSNSVPQVQINTNSLFASVPVTSSTSLSLTKGSLSASLKLNSTNTAAWLGTTTSHGLEIGTGNRTAMYIGNGRNNVFLGFGKAEVDRNIIREELLDRYNVFVKKGILSADYSIAPVDTWSDFVFSPDYRLKSLDEVETFISENKHLPDVPSAEQVSEEGYSQHEMNRVLLQKIEELTLYTIQQQKEIELLRAELNKQ